MNHGLNEKCLIFFQDVNNKTPKSNEFDLAFPVDDVIFLKIFNDIKLWEMICNETRYITWDTFVPTVIYMVDKHHWFGLLDWTVSEPWFVPAFWVLFIKFKLKWPVSIALFLSCFVLSRRFFMKSTLNL